MKKLLTFLIIAVLGSLPELYGQMLLDYSNRSTKPSTELPKPTRKVEVLSNGNIKVTYTFSSALLCPDELYSGSYSWKIGGFGQNVKPQQASVPMRVDCFEIPAGKSAKVTVSNVQYVNFSYPLAPAREPLPEIPEAEYTKDNVKPITSVSSPVPANVVSYQGTHSYRGIQFAEILVSPVLYTSSTKYIQAAKSITYIVEFSSNSSSAPSKAKSPYTLTIAPDDYFPYNSPTVPSRDKPEVNIDNNNFTTTATESDRTYAVITTNSLKESINSFVEWKRAQGYKVVILSKSSWTYADAKEAVDNLFSSYHNLYHLLIVGNYTSVPGRYINSKYDRNWQYHYSDYYYSTPSEATNSVPEISVGRIPCSNTTEVEDILAKIVNYEKSPTTSMTSSKAVVLTNFQDNNKDTYEDVRFTKTAEEIYQYIKKHTSLSSERIYYTPSDVTPLYWNKSPYSFGGALPSELKKPNFQWNGSATDITNNIKTGASILLYRGHGGETYWYAPYYNYTHAQGLTNRKLPFVFSICCLTGRYQTSNNFATEMLKGKKNRSCGIIASSTISYSGVNDSFAEGLIDAIWPSPGISPEMKYSSIGIPSPSSVSLNMVGDIYNQALSKANETFSPLWSDLCVFTKEIFHIFGDPSMYIHTEPLVDASSFATITRSEPGTELGSLKFGYVRVKLTRNAYIGLYNKATGETKRYYGRQVYQEANIGDDWIATVYDVNVKPIYSANIKITDPIGPPIGTLESVSYAPSYNECLVTLNSENMTDYDNYSLEIRDSMGSVIVQSDCTNTEKCALPLPGNAKGIYVVSLLCNGSIIESKHIIK